MSGVIRKLMFGSLILIVSLFLLRLYLLAPPQDSTADNGAQIEWGDCWFDIPITQIIHCGRLKPSLQNANNTISLPIVAIRNISLSHNKDPVIFVNGGPGSSAYIREDEIQGWLVNVEELAWQRDFIILELRGTGLSEPKPQCPELMRYYSESIEKFETLKDEVEAEAKIFLECKHRLESEGVDLSLYSTHHNAQDVIDLVNALPDDKVNLYGVSYGTRASLEIMRQQPEKVRSVILDSAYPSDKHSLPTWPWLLSNAIQLIENQCKTATTCHSKYPDVRNQLREALKRLRQQPIGIKIYEPDTDKELSTVVLSEHRFIISLFLASYDKWLYEHIVPAIYAAAEGKEDYSLYAIAENFYYFNVDDTFNDMVYAAVNCNDETGISEYEYRQLREQHPLTSRYHRYDWEMDICRDFDQDFPFKLDARPVTSTIPTLIIAGELDPVTPWEWAKEVHEHLPNSHYLKYQDNAHSVLDAEYCAVYASRSFLGNPAAKTIDHCGSQ